MCTSSQVGRTMINKSANMLKAIKLPLLLLLAIDVHGQQSNPLVALKKDTTINGISIYNMSITNNSDSILCVLRSLFVSLTLDAPQVFAPYGANSDFDDFTLEYSAIDTAHNFEVTPYIGELILPGQKLSFKIELLFSNKKKLGRLRFKYIYLNDLEYRKFMLEMRKVGSWYYKYTRHEKSVDLPNQ
jgi:hypothetical protein